MPRRPHPNRMDRQVTGSNLPEGMTADRLRGYARLLERHGFADDAAEVLAWADAIDPPKPPSVVTDEMVEAALVAFHDEYRDAPWPSGYTDRSVSEWRSCMRATIEAAVECGWTPPNLDSGTGNPSFTNRLAMAERLLRKAASLEDPPYLALGRHQMTTKEVAYLRSLDGEGDSDA